MIYSLKGKLIHIDPEFVVIECFGVGYKCFVSINTQKELPQLNQEVQLFTFMNVKEDSISLYGFAKSNELDCFKMLIGVSGVGAKMAIAALSTMDSTQILNCIAAADIKTLTKVPGVGKKLAQRIILELKDKVAKGLEISENTVEMPANLIPGVVSSNAKRAIEALNVLGYSTSIVEPIVVRFDMNLPVEEIIKLTLKELGG